MPSACNEKGKQQDEKGYGAFSTAFGLDNDSPRLRRLDRRYAGGSLVLYIYGDGTYEWYDSEGLEVMGNYYMFGDELCLEDSGMSFTLDGSGGLVDAFGDTLFLSELPQW